MTVLLRNDPLTVDLNGKQVPVSVRRNARAKKMILRVDALTGDIKLTAPRYVSERELSRFLNESQAWIAAERLKVQANPVTGHGDLLPVAGETLGIVYTGLAPRRVTRGHDQLTVGGPVDQAPARLERWLKAQAKLELSADAGAFASRLCVDIGRISIGDMKTRWGSCSSTGTLRFNWRLILAPEAVRRYVAAHEVSHLLEMNHSPQFWGHVERLVPDYKVRRKWLRERGSELMRIRFRTLQTAG